MSPVRLAANRSLWRDVRLAGVALLAAAALLLVFSPARANAQTGPCGTLPSGGATPPVSIDCTVPPAAAPYTTYTDNQQVDLSIGPNSLFSPTDANGGDIVAIECEYVNAAGMPGDPPNADNCLSQTSAQDFPFPVQPDGSFDYSGDNSGDLVNIYALPDATFPQAPITCDATNACVWYVGENYNSFTQPHVFSNPFYVTPTNPPPTTTLPPPTTTTTGATTTTIATTTTTTFTSPTTTSPTTSTTSATTTTTEGSTTTTLAGSTTSTTTSGSTTTSTSCAGCAGSTGSGPGAATGSGSGSSPTPGASSGQLALTGSTPFLMWLAALGGLLIAAGTIGRIVLPKVVS